MRNTVIFWALSSVHSSPRSSACTGACAGTGGSSSLEAGPGPQEAAEQGELRRAVDQALGQLGDSHRQVLVLRELQQLSYEEIAQALDLDLGTVKSRISRARGALRKILQKSGNLSDYLPSKPSEQKRKGGRP